LPLPGTELRVVDGAGEDLPPGEVGNLWVRGDNVFSGYWQMPEKTAEDINPEGWFNTGDQGCFDDDGYLSIVGRSKDMIITGGLNVYPKEVERVIDAQSGVLESAVIGISDADFGERVVALVVLHDGATVDAEALRLQLRDQLADFKRPKEIRILESLPRNAMGKVQKALLRNRWIQSQGVIDPPSE
jgi:malonyl-CoA/methylmalonyl-CoA synthetase